jgi:serine/threonine protein kinase
MPADLCPSPTELRDFLSGSLDSARSDVIELHIDDCEACSSQLAALHHGAEPLLAGLRQPPEDTDQFVLPGSLAAEAECQQVISELVRLGAGPAAGGPSHDPGEDLVPPQLKMIREYRLLKPIGRGGMGMVYLAEHTRLKRQVALKILPSERLADPQALSRFEREMEAVGRLDHPNIVRATDAGVIDGTHFLVMDLVDGPNIAQLARSNGPLSVADACEIVRQAAEGLQHVHEHGLVHRDIKPSNLVLTPDGTIRVLDLGLALLRTSDDVQAEELTAADQIMGTADYIAPEQAMSARTVDIRADIYSLGCTLYHLLAGQPPFRHPDYSNPLRKMMAHTNEPIPPVTNFRDDLPADLVLVLDQMLAKRPEDRLTTPKDVAKRLQPFTDGASLATLSVRGTSSLTEPALKRGTTVYPLSSAITDTLRHPSQPPSQEPEVKETESPAVRRRDGGFGRSKKLIAFGSLPLIGLLGVIVLMTGQGRLELTVNSPDVQVMIDGDPQKIEVISEANGRFVVEVPSEAGRHELHITHDGFETWTKHFWLNRGGKREFEALLTPLADHPAAERAIAPVGQQVSVRSAWDILDPATIPESERIPQLPKEVVAVAGSHRQRHWGAVLETAIRSDGKQAATAGSDGIRLWNLDTFEQTAWLNGPEHGVHHVFSVAYTPDGQRLIAGHASSRFVTLIDCRTEMPRIISRFEVPYGNTHSLEVSPSGEWLAAFNHIPKQAVLWRITDAALIPGPRIAIPDSSLYSNWPLVFSPDGQRVCVSSQKDGTVQIYGFKDGELTAGPIIAGASEDREDVPVAPLRQARFYVRRTIGDLRWQIPTVVVRHLR